MSFNKLEVAEKKAVREAMLAILNDNLIDDLEFETRVGVGRRDLAAIINSYPNIDDVRQDSRESVSINNCLNELCFGVKAPAQVWTRIGVSKEELLDIYRKWAGLRGWKSTGIQ